MSLDCKKLKEKYEDLLMAQRMFSVLIEKFQKDSSLVNLKKERAVFERYKDDVREALNYPGSVFDNLKKLAQKNNLNIGEISEIGQTSDGFFFGVVSGNLFYGDTIFREMDNKPITSNKFIHVDSEGKLCGAIRLQEKTSPNTWESKQFLLYKGELIGPFVGEQGRRREINKLCVSQDTVAYTFENEPRIYIRDSNGVSSIDNIAGQNFEKVHSVFLTPEGVLAGKVTVLGDRKEKVFVGNEFIEEVGEERVSSWHIVKMSSDGRLFGSFINDNDDNEDSGVCIFLGDYVIKKLDDDSIYTVDRVYLQPDGKLTGLASTYNSTPNSKPFIDRQLVKNIAGIEEDLRVAKLVSLANGEMAGWIEMFVDTERSSCLFVGDEIIEEIFDGETPHKIKYIEELKVLPDGTIAGLAKVEGHLGFVSHFIFDGERYVFTNEINKK